MGEFVTGEAARERFRALSDQVDAAHAEMRALSSDGVGTAFRVELAMPGVTMPALLPIALSPEG